MFIKKITIVLCVFLALLTKSQTNSLVVFSNVGQVFTLTLNNEIVNKVPEYNVKEFEYGAEGDVRNKLYDYYLKNHFPDFENIQEK